VHEKELFEVNFQVKTVEDKLAASKAQGQKYMMSVAKLTRQIAKLKVTGSSQAEQQAMQNEDYELHLYYSR
jgi:hypothetical protein